MAGAFIEALARWLRREWTDVAGCVAALAICACAGYLLTGSLLVAGWAGVGGFMAAAALTAWFPAR